MSQKLNDISVSICGVEIQKPYMDAILTIHTREQGYRPDPDHMTERQIVRVQCRDMTKFYQKVAGTIVWVDDPTEKP